MVASGSASSSLSFGRRRDERLVAVDAAAKAAAALEAVAASKVDGEASSRLELRCIFAPMQTKTTGHSFFKIIFLKNFENFQDIQEEPVNGKSSKSLNPLEYLGTFSKRHLGPSRRHIEDKSYCGQSYRKTFVDCNMQIRLKAFLTQNINIRFVSKLKPDTTNSIAGEFSREKTLVYRELEKGKQKNIEEMMMTMMKSTMTTIPRYRETRHSLSRQSRDKEASTLFRECDNIFDYI